MLLLSEADVRRLLPIDQAISLLREAFGKLARGLADNQPRRRLALPTGAVLHYMPASDGKYFGIKVYATHPRFAAHFLFLLYRAEDARPLALFEANHLGRIRTGAASGLATDLLARPDAARVGIIGSGFQARTQLEAMLAVRQIREVRIWSRSPERRGRFAEECSATFQIQVGAPASAREAIERADIVVTATNAREPVLEASWIAPGAHINAIGSNQRSRRELPSELVQLASLVVVDSLEQSRMESGDLLMGLRDWGGVRELQDVVLNPQTRGPEGVTLFKSNGLALEDVAVAGWIYETAVAEGAGREIPVLESYS